ncbi:MAG TPA: response regulator, partial [Gammaproteobacteria bacterium]|nr:response regulator [Gammaproteobacteria bacterium]
NIDVLSSSLRSDYIVKAATNGKKALQIAFSDNQPDIILLDIMMPEMDGYEVCERLKSDPATQNIPVIFITAMSETVDEELGLGLGAVDYITKPFSPALIKARVKNHIKLKQQRDQLEDLIIHGKN